MAGEARRLTGGLRAETRHGFVGELYCRFGSRARIRRSGKLPVAGNVPQRQLTARLLTDSEASANGSSGREPGIDYPAGFRVEQPLECPLPSAGNSQGQFPRKMIWRDFMLRSPEATNLQPQPTASKPAPIQELASRTLARPPDKNEEQRGLGGPKARQCGGCRSRGKSAKARQNWRCGQA